VMKPLSVDRAAIGRMLILTPYETFLCLATHLNARLAWAS
jgi:hypothetical protein